MRIRRQANLHEIGIAIAVAIAVAILLLHSIEGQRGRTC